MVAVEPLNAPMSSVIRKLLDRAPMSEGKFEFAWRTAVGPAMERVTRAALDADGTVYVTMTVSDPAWRREVKRSQHVILGKLQDLLGSSTIARLKVAAGGR
jgi:hypothetical protein